MCRYFIQDAELNRNGKSSASYHYYLALMTRTDAYSVLTKALEKTKQTGATRVLIDGISNFVIPKELDDFKKLEVEVNGKRFKVHEFFPAGKLKLAHEVFQRTISELEWYDLFVKKEKTFVLSISNIPPEPPIYIPRFLSNRIEIDESIFKTDCPDVFVFKNTIERYKLSEIARPHFTASSTSQLNHITTRFIYMDEYQDWIELKQKCTKLPLHLVNYEAEHNRYILEDSTAALEILNKVGSKKQRVYLPEYEFVQQHLSEDLKVSSVCICDTPGMGKTFLLASIAGLTTKYCPGTIVAYSQLSTFLEDFSLSPSHNSLDKDSGLLNSLKYISPSREHSKLLVKLVQAELIRVNIFFDGLDEIPSEKIESTKQIFLSIITNFPTVRIYITSRPHMRHDLEKSLGVIAYDLLAFTLPNQVDYLVRFWSPNVPELDKQSLTNYALIFLKEINKSLTKDDKEMAGIPLLCRLLAEVCANKIRLYLTTGTICFDLPLRIAAMYQQFIDQRIHSITQNESEYQSIKLYHISHALKLLFPADGFYCDKIFSTVNQVLMRSLVLKIGVIQMQSSARLEYIHRTFAEYFVAEYFSKRLHKSTIKPVLFFRKIFRYNDKTKKCLAILLAPCMKNIGDWVVHDDTFINRLIMSFIDFSLNEVKISEEIKRQVASYCGSLSPSHHNIHWHSHWQPQFISILCSCCRHNFYNLFSLLKEALPTWSLKQKKKYFTSKNCFGLSFCIRESTSQMFHSCIQLLTQVLQLDLKQIAVHEKEKTLLHIAAEVANYEAMEYFVNRFSIELPSVLVKCVEQSYDDDLNTLLKKENILNLLLNKNRNLIQETPNILHTSRVDLGLFKKLIIFGAKLTVESEFGKNCAMYTAEYMSPRDFYELV